MCDLDLECQALIGRIYKKIWISLTLTLQITEKVKETA